jgi:hypothetical protein
MLQKNILFVLFLSVLGLAGHEVKAQLKRKVLFLGNSYTGVNNLPQLVRDVALSAGDTLVFDSHTPGGYRLIDHHNDLISQSKIMNGGWDYVVIQGQSQEPITFSSQFNSAGSALHTKIKQYNPCAVTVPYMTWGRKNGDASNCASFPVMCTYQGMDTTLRARYLSLTKFINGEVSPVSVVWNYLRQNHPSIDLYQADESHPSAAGSYAAACCFYAMLFKKDPTLITFTFGLSPANASIIRNAAKLKVFDSLQLWNFKKLPVANIQYEVGPGTNELLFQSVSLGVNQTTLWHFGDGDSSTSAYAAHSYAANGTYTVTLTTTNCDLQGLHTNMADTVIQFCNHTPTVYSQQPMLCAYDTLWTQAADSFQWLAYGVPIPETSQFLANYNQYAISGFSVVSTVNGCSEMSRTFTGMYQGSGYYFDAAGVGNPCFGDTLPFVVLHINGSLPGSENIFWYKNDTLLPLMTHQDTLLISGPGKYNCQVINPVSNCPLDTTFFQLEVTCATLGFEDRREDLGWSVFPNPATETITLQFKNGFSSGQIQIFDVMGRIARELEAQANMEIPIADLPGGLYYIRQKNSRQPVLKFVKY